MTQEQFYHSRAWKRLARAFLASKNYLCELCGRPADLAHHVNLQAVCIECHNTIHYGTGGAIIRGLTFDENGDLKGESL